MVTGRHKDEIEITPEMIEAAENELAGFHTDFTTYRDGAEAIVRAALEAGGHLRGKPPQFPSRRAQKRC